MALDAAESREIPSSPNTPLLLDASRPVDVSPPTAPVERVAAFSVPPAVPLAVEGTELAVFKTLPDIFLPNAFTPGKATNNLFRPIAVGISSLQYFRVFNRWGQLVYSTSAIGQGWDGYVNGHIQDPGTYVWMAQGKAYTGNIIFRKGTVILIR